MKVNIIGPFWGTSGYANHIRGLANALDKVCDVKITTQLMPNWELQCNDAELKMINKQDEPDRVNVIIDMPFNWGQYLNKKYNIGFLVWEGDKIPRSWIENIIDNRISQVWVPSSHVYNAIKNTLSLQEWELQQVMNKVKIIPHGYNPEIFCPLQSNNQDVKGNAKDL